MRVNAIVRTMKYNEHREFNDKREHNLRKQNNNNEQITFSEVFKLVKRVKEYSHLK